MHSSKWLDKTPELTIGWAEMELNWSVCKSGWEALWAILIALMDEQHLVVFPSEWGNVSSAVPPPIGHIKKRGVPYRRHPQLTLIFLLPLSQSIKKSHEKQQSIGGTRKGDPDWSRRQQKKNRPASRRLSSRRRSAMWLVFLCPFMRASGLV